ncbi:MAG: transporter [Gemmatimonadetes bacterium]|nr:transporter [Gemmatimonadota bacterium]
MTAGPSLTEPLPPGPDAGDADDREDLGFGRVVAAQVRGRFLSRDGSPNSRKFGVGTQRLEHFYQRALAAPWPTFLGWALAAMLLVNGTFALAYSALGSGALRGQDVLGLSDPFLRAFAFSVGIFTTTGTGPMYAYGPTAHWLVVFESLFGPFVLVAIAGLLIARLTRPRMRLRFSESAVVAPYRGGRGVMFRVVNVQPGQVSDVQIRVSVALYENVNGRRERHFHQLELERKSVEFFPLHWTVVHPITASSPLRGLTPESMHAAQAELLVMVHAHEETFSTRVTARTSYLWDELRWDVKFADIFVNTADNVIAIDVERLDRTDRLPEGTTSTPAARELDIVKG